MTAETTNDAGVEYPARRWLALTVLLAAGFMDLLDTTIVNVAIPSIRGDLKANYADVQWIVAAYLLAVAVGLITGGRIGDIWGRKRTFLFGVVGFGFASLASGLAPGPGFLIGTRGLQGLFAAIMIPQILSVVQVNFPRAEQTKALALYSSIAGVAVMSGPLMAGILLDVVHVSWRAIFLVNVPVSVSVVIAAVAFIPESKAENVRGLDLGGVLLISGALFALVFGVIEGRELDWPAWIFAAMAAAVPLAGLFYLHEQKCERDGGVALISPSLLRERSFSTGLVVVVVFFSGIVGFFLSFTIFLQLGLGFTPLGSALTTFPSSIGLIVASQISAKLLPRFGRGVLAAGALLMALAMSALILTIRHFGASLSAWDVRPVILFFGLGMGLILPSLADVIIAGVNERHAGAASGVLNTGLQVGNALGVAIIGVILFSAIGSHAQSSAARVTPGLSRAIAAGGVTPATDATLVNDFRACFVAKSKIEDPAAEPASCRTTPGSAAIPVHVQSLLTAAKTTGREDNFVAAIQLALLWEVAVFIATFALLFLLPRAAEAAQRVLPAGAEIAEA